MTNFIREPCMDCFRKDKKLEELRATIERLTQQNADLRRWRALEKPITAAMAIVSNDMQELRAEIERLRSNEHAQMSGAAALLVADQNLRAEIERLTAENAELRKSNDTWVALHGPRPTAHDAEVERLRGVIRRNCDPFSATPPDAEIINEVCALEPKP